MHKFTTPAGARSRRSHASSRSNDLTFGELAIGDTFGWPEHPPGVQPLTKVDAAHYEFLIHGTGPRKASGTAEPHYPVRRARAARRRREGHQR